MSYTPTKEWSTHSISLPESASDTALPGHWGRFPKKDPKILLLEPFYPPESVWGSLKVEQGFLAPLGTISIYRWLQQKNYDVHFLDTQFGDHDLEGLKAFLRDNKFNMIGLPTFTPTAGYVFETAKFIRSVLPDCIIVLGGVHATDRSVESMEECPECDFVIRREGEITMVELIERLKQGSSEFSDIAGLTWKKGGQSIQMNPDRDLFPDLDEFPVGWFGDLDLSRYVPHPTQYIKLPSFSIVTQRGCPYPCTFCEAATALGKKLRVFSPQRVIEEIKILKNEKGARGLYFQDSTFTMNRKYIVEFLELMIKNNLNDLLWSCLTRTDRVDPELLALMHEAGCRSIAYGIESANQASLDILKKNIKVEVQERGVEWTHNAKISTLCSYILCLPGETEEMVENTINYARKIGSAMALFYLPVPYPGSELYQACKDTGGIREASSWNDYLSIDFDNPVYINPLIGKERMRYWYKEAYWRYFTRTPRVWKSNLLSLLRNGNIGRYARGMNAVKTLLSSNMKEHLSLSKTKVKPVNVDSTIS